MKSNSAELNNSNIIVTTNRRVWQWLERKTPTSLSTRCGDFSKQGNFLRTE